MNERVRQKLSEIVQRYGRAICREPKRCKGLLLDHCAGDRREVFVLVSALEEQVVGDLLQDLGGQSWGLVSGRLIRRLVENRAMAEDAALWAVESWAMALGVISEAGFTAGRPARQALGSKPSPHKTGSAHPGDSTRSVSGPSPGAVPDVIRTGIGEVQLKLIPAGEFWMGSPDNDVEAYDDEKPRHKVLISQPFYLGVTPVTQLQFEAVMGENPSRFRGQSFHPVESVTLYDAVRFCNALSRREGLRPCYYEVTGLPRGNVGGVGYRLPTEAEWEYACRAGTERRYCFGDGWARLCDYAWYSANSQKQTCPVGQKRANDFGLFDMHGNVWEWCFDNYERSYYRQSPDVDPLAWRATAHRVARGGSWNDQPPDVRAAVRQRLWVHDKTDFLGFRVARGIPSR